MPDHWSIYVGLYWFNWGGATKNYVKKDYRAENDKGIFVNFGYFCKFCIKRDGKIARVKSNGCTFITNILKHTKQTEGITVQAFHFHFRNPTLLLNSNRG